MDLGQPERLNVFGIAIPVLAIVVVISQYLLSKVMEAPTSGQDDQAASMTKSMGMMMPLMMGWMAFQFSAGLALYFVVTNIITTVQYSIQGRTDWSKILPFVKSNKTATPGIVDVRPTPIMKKSDSSQYIDVPDDDGDDDEPVAAPVKVVKPSARSASKQLRPKRKK